MGPTLHSVAVGCEVRRQSLHARTPTPPHPEGLRDMGGSLCSL